MTCWVKACRREDRWLARHRKHKGGRPSTLIIAARLTPYALGALLALYEHKIFVQALIWVSTPLISGASKQEENGQRRLRGCMGQDQNTTHSFNPLWISVLNQGALNRAARRARLSGQTRYLGRECADKASKRSSHAHCRCPMDSFDTTPDMGCVD